jgi:surfeit locus 1 family protein
VPGPTPRRGIVIPSIATAAAFGVLLSLGSWQLERKAWKEGLIATLAQRLQAPPVPLPATAQWSRLTAVDDEFRRVVATAEFLHDRQAAVYTLGSSMRDDGAAGSPGYWIFTPARLADGAIVMVNRGFVPEGKRDPATRPNGDVKGPVNLTGVLRWPERGGVFTPAADPTRNMWFSRDSDAIAAAAGVTAAPFYVELEGPEPPGGLPRTGHLQPVLPNNHLGYAMTWFGLAAVLVAVYGAWLVGARRNDPP